jgi:hypothetical protein
MGLAARMHSMRLVGSLTLATVVVISAAACGAKSTDSANSAAMRSPSDSGPSGTFDEWRDAVCFPGYYFPGSKFPGTTDGGSCFGRNGPNSSRGDMLYVTEWSSAFDLQNAMSRYGMAYYVSVSDNGAPTAFSVNWNAHGDAALQPLTTFGFTITSA